MSRKKIKVVYVTSSRFKKDENSVFVANCKLPDGTPVSDVFEFEIREVPIAEMLEVDLRVLVQAEVTNAYSQIRVPCVVEHAGLIFEEFLSENYPGGLTKPMWNALKDKFVVETHSSGRRAVARAVVAYCDGTQVLTFVGDTKGKLADSPRGSRAFYWDTVFIPDGTGTDKTFAEIVDDPAMGLLHKVVHLSQSTKAMMKFLEYRRVNQPVLWSRYPS
jgi:inosine/xanthosine triphosphate pyrophosphatase family protein